MPKIMARERYRTASRSRRAIRESAAILYASNEASKLRKEESAFVNAALSPSDSFDEFSALSARAVDVVRKASSSVLSPSSSSLEFASVSANSSEFFLELDSSFLSLTLSSASRVEISMSRESSFPKIVGDSGGTDS